MKVLAVTNIMAPYRVDFFNNLNEKGKFELTVVYSKENEDNRKWKIEKNDVRHNFTILKSKTLKISGGMDPKYIHIPFNIIEKLNEIQPDIIIGCEYNPTVLMAFIWSKLNRKKYISWSDGTLNSEKNISGLQKQIRRIICRNSKSLIASSTMTKKAQVFYGANPQNVFVSYLTVDLKKYEVSKNSYGSKNILFVGRLSEIKGIDLLLNAIRHIKKEYTLNIVGDGPEEEALKKLCRELNLEHKVNFLGFRQGEELRQIYSIADCLILPSRQECFGLVMTEAMSAGVPVIASKYVDGAYDLIDDSINGFIVDPYDEMLLKSKIELLLDNDELVKKMGTSSMEKVKDFSLEKVSEEFIKAIEFANRQVK